VAEVSGVRCPGCGFEGLPGQSVYSMGWYVEHERVHLATFPDLDQRSRDNLADATKLAAGRWPR